MVVSPIGAASFAGRAISGLRAHALQWQDKPSHPQSCRNTAGACRSRRAVPPPDLKPDWSEVSIVAGLIFRSATGGPAKYPSAPRFAPAGRRED